jgi:RNA polymerase sigma-70 factor, ECF subfamily
MTPLPPDQDLADGLRAGSHDAFERVYGDYHPAIYNLCARIVGDREEARDLTQDVFIKAFSSPPAAGGSSALRPWLYRVATNACFNHLRARTKLGGDGTAIDAARAPVDEYERARTVALVEQTLGELNERYRTALVLKDLHGLPATEIAEVMAVSRPAADVLVHRARASFKSVFARLGGDTGAAPASLGLVLAPLSVPAALHVLPPLPAPLGGLPHAAPASPPHPAPLPDLSSAGPVGAGLLTKIGAALSSKIGVTAAAATLAVGGGAAVYETASHGDHSRAAALSQQASHGEGGQDASHDASSHDTRSGDAGHLDSHGGPVRGHIGHWEGQAGSSSWQDQAHVAEGGGATSDTGGAGSTGDHAAGGDGTSGTSTTHDTGGTWTGTHDDTGTSSTHEPDSGR